MYYDAKTGKEYKDKETFIYEVLKNLEMVDDICIDEDEDDFIDETVETVDTEENIDSKLTDYFKGEDTANSYIVGYKILPKETVNNVTVLLWLNDGVRGLIKFKQVDVMLVTKTYKDYMNSTKKDVLLKDLLTYIENVNKHYRLLMGKLKDHNLEVKEIFLEGRYLNYGNIEYNLLGEEIINPLDAVYFDVIVEDSKNKEHEIISNIHGKGINDVYFNMVLNKDYAKALLRGAYLISPMGLTELVEMDENIESCVIDYYNGNINNEDDNYFEDYDYELPYLIKVNKSMLDTYSHVFVSIFDVLDVLNGEYVDFNYTKILGAD